jgi:hypothetical protein
LRQNGGYIYQGLRAYIALLVAIPSVSQETHLVGSHRTQCNGGEHSDQRISGPSAITVDNRGHLFVVEMEKGRVQRIDLGTGVIVPVAGKRGNERCHEGDAGRQDAQWTLV